MLLYKVSVFIAQKRLEKDIKLRPLAEKLGRQPIFLISSKVGGIRKLLIREMDLNGGLQCSQTHTMHSPC